MNGHLLAFVAWVHLSILYPPSPVSINGRHTFYYELQVINTSAHPVIVDKLTISPRSAIAVTHNSATTLRPGDTTLLYIELTTQTIPDSLVHHLQLRDGNQTLTQTISIPVDNSAPLAIGPPFHNGTWAAVREPSWERGHRRVTYTVDGHTRIPGRYAIDFIQLDDNGRYAKNNEDSIRNWLGYSTEVLAVTDGIVTATRNDFPESNTLSAHPKYPSSQASGNYISIQTGKDRFVFYEHLQPGSIRVRPGQTIKKGEAIARLGFTGQTTGPHLHLHVADAGSPLGAEGVPFVFDSFTLLGSYPDLTSFGKDKWTPQTPAVLKKEYPAPNTVLRF